MVPDQGPSSAPETGAEMAPRPLGFGKWPRAVWSRFPVMIRRVWPFLLVGVAVRLVLAPISLNTDLTVYAQTAVATVYGQGLYSHPTVYPPFWVLYLNAVGRTTAWFVPGPQWFTSSTQLQNLYVVSSVLTPEFGVTTTFVMLEKSSLMLFDLATGFLLYHLAVRQTGKTNAGVAMFALWFLNPYVIILSSVHGSYDVVPTFCTVAAFVLALELRPALSGLAVASGVFVGIFPLFFVPVLAAILWKAFRTPTSRPWRPILRFVAGLAVPVAAVLAVPGLLSTYISSATVGPSRGALYQGFGFWGVFSIPGLRTADRWLSNAPGTLVVAGFAIVAGVIALAVAFRVLRVEHAEQITSRFWALAASACCLGAFLVPQVFQPQYVVWVLPFVALLSLGNRSYRILYVVLSAIPAAFYFILAGPYLNFLPLWYNYHLVSYPVIYSSIKYWVRIQPITFPAMFVPAFAVTLTLAVLVFRELFQRRTPAEASGGTSP